MYTLISACVMLAATASSLPGTRLALADQPVFNAPIWGAPCLTRAPNGQFYSFATDMYGMNVPQAHSSDFKAWDWVKRGGNKHKDAMPDLPTWTAKPPRLWAPDVSKLVSPYRLYKLVPPG